MGDVVAIDSPARTLSVKNDKGETFAVVPDSKAMYYRVAPGETSLKNAVRIDLSSIAAGDRVLARGRFSEDRKSLAASSVIVISKADIARKQQQEREDWERRGTSGKVTRVDAAAPALSIERRSPAGINALTVEISGATQFRRYAPDSVRFSDARPSSLAEIKPGDQVRVLGNRNEDGSRIQAEQVVSGSFRNIPATVIRVNAAAGEVVVKDLETKQPLTVKVNADSTLRRLPPAVAAMLARRLKPGAQPEERARDGPATPRPGNHPGGRQPDLDRMLERMPPLTLAELTPGDAVVVSSTAGAEPGRVTAITLVAGVEPILTAAPPRQVGGAWNFGDIELPQ